MFCTIFAPKQDQNNNLNEFALIRVYYPRLAVQFKHFVFLDKIPADNQMSALTPFSVLIFGQKR
jgi:hypothetical protein